mmetsp:Transcript_7006/g.8883  ORF Transcript_7006/g.8883 Transcript_7006/m.8883 type:complete len:613 (+) Transcript_7006:192-2030(+)
MAKDRNQTKKSRTRSGCLTCRDRHMKCDEQQPVCNNCIKSKRKCFRGIRLNFTQYTIYEPPNNPYQNNLSYRILDQSVTIASLYEDGKKQYESYVPFHSWEDLRESDIQYQKDMHCSMPSTNILTDSNVQDADDDLWIHQYQPTPRQLFPETLPFDNNSISENSEITNLLMNDSTSVSDEIEQYQSIFQHRQMQLQQAIPEMNESRDMQNLASDSDISYNVGAKDFINLVQHQKYYWFLDLFNELSIWKLIIPNYCLKLTEVEHSTDESNTFLINCLVNCSLQNSIDLNKILEQQLQHWLILRPLRLAPETFSKLERLLISIVLILLNLLTKLQHGIWQFDDSSKLIFNNQIKIFNQSIEKLQDLNDAKLRKVKSVVLISAIHSISILKFFINNQFKHNRNQFDVTDEISYSHTKLTAEFTTLNHFEIININSFYKKFEYPQISYNLQVQPSRSPDTKSDSLKLRQFIWYLIKLDFILKNPTNTLIEMDYNFIFTDENTLGIPPLIKSPREQQTISGTINQAEVPPASSVKASKKKRRVEPVHSIILPNDKGIAIMILREYINKLINSNDEDIQAGSNESIKSILESINKSMIEPEIKLLWDRNFRWTLNDI